MRHLPRDGVINDRGLIAEFRFINGHPCGSAVSYVETAAGPMWVHDEFLTYDPPRDLSPEAAAVVGGAQNAMKTPKEWLDIVTAPDRDWAKIDMEDDIKAIQAEAFKAGMSRAAEIATWRRDSQESAMIRFEIVTERDERP